jgi:hypothetical protein
VDAVLSRIELAIILYLEMSRLRSFGPCIVCFYSTYVGAQKPVLRDTAVEVHVSLGVQYCCCTTSRTNCHQPQDQQRCPWRYMRHYCSSGENRSVIHSYHSCLKRVFVKGVRW